MQFHVDTGLPVSSQPKVGMCAQWYFFESSQS